MYILCVFVCRHRNTHIHTHTLLVHWNIQTNESEKSKQFLLFLVYIFFIPLVSLCIVIIEMATHKWRATINTTQMHTYTNERTNTERTRKYIQRNRWNGLTKTTIAIPQVCMCLCVRFFFEWRSARNESNRCERRETETTIVILVHTLSIHSSTRTHFQW